MFDDITLAEIGQLKANGTITVDQAQDLIRQKGIPLSEYVPPQTPTQLQPFQKNQPFQFKPGTEPTNLVEPQKITQLQASLNVIKDGFHHKQVSLTEAVREGIAVINGAIDRMKHEALVQMNKLLKEPTVQLSPESVRMFELLRREMFDQFRDCLLPTGLKGAQKPVESYTIIPNSS
jgi:hypothetical protein